MRGPELFKHRLEELVEEAISVGIGNSIGSEEQVAEYIATLREMYGDLWNKYGRLLAKTHREDMGK